MANTSIQLKESGVTGNVPASLTYGELAINYADGKLFYKHANGSIASISTGSLTNSFATVNSNSSLILATSATDTLSIVPGNNITISTDTVGKTITINSVSAGSAADQFARDTANNASANTIILQGINTTQNTRLNSIETINTNQNTSISIIQGVDNTQNTNITSVNQYAAGAYAKANSALANTSGATFGGDLHISGNVDVISISFPDGTRQYTSPEATSSYANSAFTAANSAGTYANTALQYAVPAGVYANAAFVKANTPWSYLANGVNTVSLDSIGQLILPQVTQGDLTSGFLTSAGKFTFNANGNLWVLDENGNFISPYNRSEEHTSELQSH